MKTAFLRILATLVCVTYFFAGISLDAQTLRLPDSVLRFRYTAPDSLHPVEAHKTTYRYDNALRVAETTEYGLDPVTSGWLLELRTNTTYNAASLPIRNVSEEYDPASPSYPSPLYVKDSLEYDAQGRVIRRRFWQTVTLPNYVPWMDISTHYWGNPTDSITTILSIDLGLLGGITPVSKTVETFAPGFESTSEYAWDGAAWTPTTRSEHAFTPGNDIRTQLTGDPLTNTWVPVSQATQLTMPSLKVNTSAEWDPIQSWQVRMLDSLFLSPAGLALTRRRWLWDTGLQQLTCHGESGWAYHPNDSVRYRYDLTCGGDTTSTMVYTYYPAGGFAANLLQQSAQWVYDNNAPLFKGFNYRFFYTPSADSAREWYTYGLLSRDITYYGYHTVGVEAPVQQPLFVVHNNGAANPLCASLAEADCALRLVNVQGTVIWKFQLSPKTSMALPHLPAGVYVLEGHSATGTFRQKVLIP